MRSLTLSTPIYTGIMFTILQCLRMPKLYAQRKEYEFALNPIPLYYKSYEEPHLGIHPQWEGREFVLLDGECEVLDGISVYPTPGHSVGHQTVVVNTKEGQFHCCGDLIFTYDNLNHARIFSMILHHLPDL